MEFSCKLYRVDNTSWIDHWDHPGKTNNPEDYWFLCRGCNHLQRGVGVTWQTKRCRLCIAKIGQGPKSSLVEPPRALAWRRIWCHSPRLIGKSLTKRPQSTQKHIPSDAIIVKLHQQSLMGYWIERFGEIEEYNISLTMSVDWLCPVVYGWY